MTTYIILAFIIGYVLIAIEHYVNINKAAIALLTGVVCWLFYIIDATNPLHVSEELLTHLGEISGILFFLLGAMTIVELIDAHNGFDLVTNLITTNKERNLLWIVSLLTFFLSAVLDNLTATIVMVSLVRKLIEDDKKRLYFAGMVIIAANAGGAWSPIGDVTTTMLWIGGQITGPVIIKELILPSSISLLVPLFILSFKFKGTVARRQKSVETTVEVYKRNIIFVSGIGMLLFVPVFKTLTHLPPFMGMLFALAVLWIITEVLHKHKEEEEKHNFSVVNALQKIDTPSILFFLGILLSVSALQITGQLSSLAHFLDEKIANTNLIVLSIGLLSAVIDNVPLVAASIGMYDLSLFPTDHYFWKFLAYCAGTGGSALIIGSAAGVAAMGIERISFVWYLKHITWLALIGYIAGALVYMGMNA